MAYFREDTSPDVSSGGGMTMPDDLVKRLRGLNNNFAITDLGLCRIYEEAAATIEAQAAEISRLTVELARLREPVEDGKLLDAVMSTLTEKIITCRQRICISGITKNEHCACNSVAMKVLHAISPHLRAIRRKALEDAEAVCNLRATAHPIELAASALQHSEAIRCRDAIRNLIDGETEK
jgi:hypothetical protein